MTIVISNISIKIDFTFYLRSIIYIKIIKIRNSENIKYIEIQYTKLM